MLSACFHDSVFTSFLSTVHTIYFRFCNYLHDQCLFPFLNTLLVQYGQIGHSKGRRHLPHSGSSVKMYLHAGTQPIQPGSQSSVTGISGASTGGTHKCCHVSPTNSKGFAAVYPASAAPPPGLSLHFRGSVTWAQGTIYRKVWWFSWHLPFISDLVLSHVWVTTSYLFLGMFQDCIYDH